MTRDERREVGAPHCTREPGEPTRGTRGRERGAGVTDLLEGKATDTQRPAGIASTKLQRIAEKAREEPELVFTSLGHLIDNDLLMEAVRLTRKDGAAGVDGQTADEFVANLHKNVEALGADLLSGRYRAPPVRRVHIPKAGGGQRPIGIPTFADKVAQRAVAMVLGAVYEQDFLDCSYGFRPNRSPHQALEALRVGLLEMGGGWVLDVDLEDFFGSLVHAHLRDFLDKRVRDGKLRRLIDKWLAAGVLADGELSHPDAGTPQGGVISPLLANVYLHEVIDRWFAEVVLPALDGKGFLIRYADDLVIVCELERDAMRVKTALEGRLGRFGLRLNANKTRLVRFGRPRPRGEPRGGGDGPQPRGFDFLGFTHYWGRSRQGAWVVKKKTAKGRLQRAAARVAEWMRRNRHLPIRTQHIALGRKLRGHDAYYGVTGNAGSLQAFRYVVTVAWRRALDRRGGRRRMTWSRFADLLKRFPLPPAKVVHSVYRQAANP